MRTPEKCVIKGLSLKIKEMLFNLILKTYYLGHHILLVLLHVKLTKLNSKKIKNMST